MDQMHNIYQEANQFATAAIKELARQTPNGIMRH